MRITEEQIERANSVNLPLFLMANGFELKKVGREYSWKEHDSLNIKDNEFGERGQWFQFSTQEGGDNIAFVQKFMNKSFVEAVEMLNGEVYVRDFVPSHSYEYKPKKVQKSDISIAENVDCKRVFAYLCKTRGLDYGIISELVKSGKIAQEQKTGNAVFKILDENNRLVGAEKVGTSTQKKFKGIATGSASGYGFEVCKGNGENLLFFESSIDMLSYLQMYGSRLENHRLVSMMGVKPNTVIDTMKRHEISPENVFICSDNDKAGNELFTRLQNEFPQMKRIFPNNRYKDWNDALRDIPKEKEEVGKVTTYGNKTWNDATDNRNKTLVSMDENNFMKLKNQLDNSGINYFAYAKNDTVVMAVNDKDIDWLKQIAGNENLPTRKSNVEYIPPQKNIIGNAEYRYISDKQYISADSDTALKMAEIMLSRNVQFSGRIYPNGKATLTISGADLAHVQAIQQSVIDMRKQFAKSEKADEIIGNKAYRDIRQRQFFYSKLTPEQYKEVQPYLDTDAQYSGLIRDNKVIFTVEKEDSATFHRALENAQREVSIINSLKNNSIDGYRLEKLSAVIHRFAVEDIHESLDSFFTPQLDEKQFDKMLSLVNDYLAQFVSERYGEFSGLNAILDFKNEIDRTAELTEFFSEHNFSDEQKNVITEMFIKDSSKTNIEIIDETFSPDEIREYYDILHNQLVASDVTEFLENRRKPELTDKEKAFLNGDILPFMSKSVLAWDEIEDLGYRLFEDGYNDKYAPSEKAIFGNGLKETALYGLAHRMQNGEDIRRDLAVGLLGGQKNFTTTQNNDFTVEYGENSVTARYENAERQLSYENLGDAFLSLIKSEYDDIIHDRTVENLRDIFPDITDETADKFINAFDGAVMHGWQDNEVIQRKIKKALYEILGDEDNTEKAFASIADMKYNFKVETEKESPIHFGLFGNGITAYDISRTDKETDDYVTVAHISPEGVVKVYDDSISADDMAKINDEARSAREKFMAEWDSLDTTTQFQKLYERADTETMLNIGKETLSTEEKIAKYMPFVFFGEGERPEPEIAPENKDLGSVTMRKVSDFYEMYGKNAEIGAEVLGLHLITKNGENMVGFPDFAKDENSEKLRNAGYSVLIEEAFEINPPKQQEKLISDISEIAETAHEEIVNPLTLVFNGDKESLEEVKDKALSLGATCTLIASGLAVDTYENHKDELLSTAYELGVLVEIRSVENPDIAEDDAPLFVDADVIEEIEKSENSTDNRPFWETPDVQGEQLSLFGDSVPFVAKKVPEQDKKVFADGLFVGNVNRFTALHNEIMRGTGFQDSKLRVKKFYDEKKPANKDFADFLKHEYGMGGHSGDGEIRFVDHDSKGMFFTLDSGEKFKFTWSDIAEMTSTIIDKGEYITQEDIDHKISHEKYTNEHTNSDSAFDTANEPAKDEKATTIEVGDKFRNKMTGEISEVISLTGALPWYTEDCTVRRESSGFAIEENVPYSTLFNTEKYEYLGKGEVPENSEKSPEISDKITFEMLGGGMLEFKDKDFEKLAEIELSSGKITYFSEDLSDKDKAHIVERAEGFKPKQAEMGEWTVFTDKNKDGVEFGYIGRLKDTSQEKSGRNTELCDNYFSDDVPDFNVDFARAIA